VSRLIPRWRLIAYAFTVSATIVSISLAPGAEKAHDGPIVPASAETLRGYQSEWSKLKRQKPDTSVRDLFDSILNAAALGAPDSDILDALRFAKTARNVNSHSPLY